MAIIVPDALPRLLAFSNGGEGSLPVQPLNFCLYSAEEIAEIALSRSYEELCPGLVVFGSNGAGEAIALDTRASTPFPVVNFDMTNGNLD